MAKDGKPIRMDRASQPDGKKVDYGASAWDAPVPAPPPRPKAGPTPPPKAEDKK